MLALIPTARLRLSRPAICGLATTVYPSGSRSTPVVTVVTWRVPNGGKAQQSLPEQAGTVASASIVPVR
jgi:hypothetical protein